VYRGLRLGYLVTALVLLLILPIGQASVTLVLFVAADLGAAALMLRPIPARPTPVEVLSGDVASLGLLRRTVPQLRMRRPAATIEEQVRWREAAEARRNFRVVS
jgi:hypothetical protein